MRKNFAQKCIVVFFALLLCLLPCATAFAAPAAPPPVYSNFPQDVPPEELPPVFIVEQTHVGPPVARSYREELPVSYQEKRYYGGDTETYLWAYRTFTWANGYTSKKTYTLLKTWPNATEYKVTINYSFY